MQNRWFHLPELHSPLLGHDRKVGWLELFYDLIYVATIIQLGTALSDEVSFLRFVGFAAIFVPIWYTWTGFTFINNRFIVDDFVHRCIVFAQMFAIGGMAVLVPDVLTGDHMMFVLFYAGARLLLVVQYIRFWIQVPEARPMAKRYVFGFSVGIALWLTSAFVPTPWVYGLWAIAMLVDLATPLNRKARAIISRYPPDLMHMSERYGLLTLIVLGESFVKVLTTLSEQGPDFPHAVMCLLALLITCSLWWIYFDDVAGSRIKIQRRLATYAWVYSHLPLTIAITGVGVAIKKAVTVQEVTEGMPTKYRVLLCGTLCLALLAVGLIDAFTERRQAELSDKARVNARILSAVGILALIPAGAFMPAWVFVGLVSLICVLQVVFDLSMAPMAQTGEEAHHTAHQDSLRAARQTKDAVLPQQRKRTRRLDISDAVRRGIPNEVRRDLYFHFMEGSWVRLIVTMVFLYLCSNFFFAALYMLEPGAIDNADPGSFMDAFFFSVQTMSTIGYGALTPNSTWANIIVVVEVAVGLMGFAVCTGLIFARISRPRAPVLFSNVVVINEHHGVPTLKFRAGNAAGSEIVEASMKVAVLIEELSPEGHALRRLHDLHLERSMSPLFALSWAVMHKIDESSPLYGVTPDNIEDRIFNMIVTLKGHDATYAQTSHARKMYYPEDFRFDERFVDVISHLPDGRLVIDYDRFHDTVPSDVEMPPPSWAERLVDPKKLPPGLAVGGSVSHQHDDEVEANQRDTDTGDDGQDERDNGNTTSPTQGDTASHNEDKTTSSEPSKADTRDNESEDER